MSEELYYFFMGNTQVTRLEEIPTFVVGKSNGSLYRVSRAYGLGEWVLLSDYKWVFRPNSDFIVIRYVKVTRTDNKDEYLINSSYYFYIEEEWWRIDGETSVFHDDCYDYDYGNSSPCFYISMLSDPEACPITLPYYDEPFSGKEQETDFTRQCSAIRSALDSGVNVLKEVHDFLRDNITDNDDNYGVEVKVKDPTGIYIYGDVVSNYTFSEPTGTKGVDYRKKGDKWGIYIEAITRTSIESYVDQWNIDYHRKFHTKYILTPSITVEIDIIQGEEIEQEE